MKLAIVLAVSVASGAAHAEATVARCLEGVALLNKAKPDLFRARVRLDRCDEIPLPPESAAEIRASLKKANDAVEKAKWSRILVTSEPEGVTFQLDGETLTTPVTVWLPGGPEKKPLAYKATYTVGTVNYEKSFDVVEFSRSMVILEGIVKAPGKAKDGSVSFEEEGEIEDNKGPPPDIKHPPMTDGKYRRDLGPKGPELDDPLALGPHCSVRPWIGVRLGGGVYDDGATAAAWRPTVAATTRIRLARTLFLAARLDYSRRGGEASTSVGTAGANIGAGYTLLATSALQVSAIGQLRGELHFTDERDAMDVNRAGAGVSAGVEVAFWQTPLTVGIRGEQSFTELVPGARDRALLLELGVDWR